MRSVAFVWKVKGVSGGPCMACRESRAQRGPRDPSEAAGTLSELERAGLCRAPCRGTVRVS